MNNLKTINIFLKYLTDKGVSSSSLKYYKSDIVNFLKWKGQREINTSLVREYLNSIRLTTPNSTINRRLSTLRSYSQFINSNFMNGIENVGFNKATSKSSDKNTIYNIFYSKIASVFSKSQKLQNLLYKIFFNRPNWYKKYHAYPIASYIHIAILILFSSLSGYAVYDQVFYSTDRSLAFPTALERPNRYLSFQGRLTDDLGNPETTATNMVFKLYNVSSGGTALWDSSTCSITPDQDGIFSTLLGSSCGSEIASSVFSENAEVWLGVAVGTDSEATPRIQIATVAYALNSETLQGFPAGTGTSTIPYIDSTGKLAIAASSPTIESTSGTFAVKGQAMTISTADTTNGDITINPDGTGTLNLTFEGASPDGGANGFVNAVNANITSGSLYAGTVASNATGYNFINFLSGSSPTSVFSVQNDGDIITSGDITIGGGNINTGNIALTIGDATTDSITLQTDGTGNGEVVLPNDSIGPNEILSSGQTDEYCLTYEATGTTFEWQTCGSGGGGTMSSFTASGDTGGGQSISDGNTLSILGGTNGIDTVDSATDTITLNLDTTEIGTTTFGSGSNFTWTLNSSATVDPTLLVDADSIDLTLGTANDLFNLLTGNLKVGNGTPGLTLNGEDAYVEGTFEVDGNSQFDGSLDSNGDLSIADTNIAFDGASTTFTTTGAFTLTPGGAVIFGDGGDTLSIDTSDWDITTVGNMSGIGTISSDGDWTNSQVTPSIFLTDTTASSDDYSINVDGNAFDITNATDSRVELQFVGDGSINLGNNTTTKTINIGGTSSSASDTINIATNSTASDTISIGNSNSSTLMTLTGGDDWIINSNGNIATLGTIQTGSVSSLAYSRFGTNTTGHAGNLTNASDLLISSDLEVDGTLFLDSGTISNSAGTASIVLSSTPTTTANTLSSGNWLVDNTANVGQAALMVNQTKSGDLFTASTSGTTKFTIQNDGDVVLTNGQLRLGNLSSAPTAEGAGSMYFNTTTNTHQCYNGTNWYNCGGTLYSNTNASVSDGSYITVTHNLSSNDLLSSAWINSQGTWKSLDASYKPAIAWEGKDTQKGVYHNSVNDYRPQNEISAPSATLQEGMVFDTFEDTTKTDSSNTTVSMNQLLGDDGSSNFINLDQRIQGGRVGLIGDQTLNTSNTDNDGQTYLGSNTVNDIYYYDRAKDSTPEVLVELGIDPNWYNGVTLSVATSSASYSQNGTLADKNPNLTTTYNGSLIKATGTDSTPRTIYITIKSPTTFDWTNYQGDSATAVTITPGTAQTLGSTGVSVTFTGGVSYNVGDVFKIASWYIEAEGTDRGAKQQFPERSYIVASADSVDIIDADTQKLWIRFTGGTSNMLYDATNYSYTSVQGLNGNVYVGLKDTTTDGTIYKINFGTDTRTSSNSTASYMYNGTISQRNGSMGNITASSADTYYPRIVASPVNDVAAAVIPNQPTQEITVSGWGYFALNATQEIVSLPFTFNNNPRIVVAHAGYQTTVPTSLSNCTNSSGRVVTAENSSTNYFQPTLSSADASNYHCYSWTATGTVSPKQFVAVATGAASADGGTTIINETNGSSVNVMVGSQDASTVRNTKVAIANNTIYAGTTNTTPLNWLSVYYGIHGSFGDSTYVAYRSGFYYVNSQAGGWPAAGPVIMGATAADEIKSLYVTPNTSIHDPDSSTIYVGTTTGLTVINEKRGESYSQSSSGAGDGIIESSGSVKYYTKDYISEEMIGDIRGMWPLNNANSASDFEDVSIKANTLTGTNITAAGDSVSGVRGTATDFDGSTESLTRADDADLDFAASENFSLGIWFKHNGVIATNPDYLITKADTSTGGYKLYMNASGAICFDIDDDATFTPDDQACTTTRHDDSQWHHVVAVKNATTSIQIFVDGVLANQDTTIAATGTLANTNAFYIGVDRDGTSNEWDGSLDEAFITATALNGDKIKNMYQVGSRALQSHGTTLGGGSADANQQLGYISTGTSTIGVAQPDYNNQYLYVGANSTTLGGLSKIQLNSDTNIKTFNSSANVPTGGTLLLDEDVTSLAVGETLYAVGSAASGVKTMGLDNNSTATSGNFVSKTYTLPKNIGSAVLWVSPIIDGSDVSNTLTVQASNDGGTNYATCTLVNTNSNYDTPEREYACTFSTADNDLKVRFQFARGSTKTNTYVVQYGISWLGETGFRVEQADSNNVRLYNFSGETQNLKLNVTGASTSALANPWTDAGSYLYATGYETLRIYDGSGTNYLGISHDGTLANLSYNGTTVLSINSSGDVLPNTNDSQNLGSDLKRWKDLFLGGETLHIGTSTTDEATISYNTATNILDIGTDSTTNGDISFFTDDLYLDKSTGNVAVGTSNAINTRLAVIGDNPSSALFSVSDGSTSNVSFAITDSGYSYFTSTQFSNVFSCVGASCTSSDSGTFTNNTTEAKTNSGTAFSTIGTGTTATFYLGLDHKFATLYENIATAAVGNTMVKEYWNGSAWTALSGVSDGTTNLTTNGQITWTVPSDWTTKTVNSASAYWIRLRSSTNITTSPTVYSISPTIGTRFSVYGQTGNSTPTLSVSDLGITQFLRPDIHAGATLTQYITYDTSASNEYFATMISDADGTPDNEFLFRTDGTANADGSFTGGGADVAEYYYLQDYVEEGDLVSIPSELLDNYPAGKTLEKSKGNKYDSKVVGIVSTNPGLVAGGGDTDKADKMTNTKKTIALVGRVPTKVNLENGEIKKGDYLTSSSVAGVAMKATDEGKVIGIALEDYNGTQKISDGTKIVEKERIELSPEYKPLPEPGNEIGKIMVFVNNSWINSQIAINDYGNLTVNGDEVNGFKVIDKDGFEQTKVAALAKAIIGNIKTGVLEGSKIVSTKTNTNIISPIADSNLIIDLDSDDNNNDNKLVIVGKDNQEVASIDSNGNSNFEGDTTISGTLYANNIESKRIEDIEKMLREVESSQTALNNIADWSTNTDNDNIEANRIAVETAEVNNLYVTNQIAASSLFISNILTVSSIDSIEKPLEIQSLASNSIQIMAGSITIDTNGDTKFLGNVEIAGDLNVNGTSNIKSAVFDNFMITDSISATDSAEISKGEIVSNSIAGKATLAANTESIRINNDKINEKTLVYITPISSTENKVLYVKNKNEGFFEVGFSDTLERDVEFNWWIIKLSPTEVK